MSAEERDFLDEFSDHKEPATEVDETPETETEVAETADAKPVETPESEAPAATDPPTETHVPYAAMKAEREKRQERERELKERDRRIADYERQLEELRNGAQPTTKQPIEIWEDPDAFIRERVGVVEQQATQRLYAALEAQARETFPDYDDVFAVVQEHAKTNPAIAQQVLGAPNPAVAAYKLGKQLAEMKQMQDPAAYRAKVEAEVRAAIAAEEKASAEAKRKAAEAIPPDLSSSRNVAGSDAVPVEDTFESLFPRN